MTEVLSHERVPEPLPAGARSRPPTYPPAPPGCGEGGSEWSGGGQRATAEPPLLEEFQLSLDAAFSLLSELRVGTALRPVLGEQIAHSSDLTRTAIHSLRSRLQWAQWQALIGFGMDWQVCGAFKRRVLEMSERPVATLEMEQRWRGAYERLLAPWVASHPDWPNQIELLSYRHARQMLAARWLPAPLFMRAVFRELARELNRFENCQRAEHFEEAVIQPLVALLLASMDVCYAPGQRTRWRAIGPHRARE